MVETRSSHQRYEGESERGFVGVLCGVGMFVEECGVRKDMQAELLALREQRRRARQPGPEAHGFQITKRLLGIPTVTSSVLCYCNLARSLYRHNHGHITTEEDHYTYVSRHQPKQHAPRIRPCDDSTNSLAKLSNNGDGSSQFARDTLKERANCASLVFTRDFMKCNAFELQGGIALLHDLGCTIKRCDDGLSICSVGESRKRIEKLDQWTNKSRKRRRTSLTKLQTLDRLLVVAYNDLMDRNSLQPIAERNLTTKGGLMIIYETTIITNCNPFKKGKNCRLECINNGPGERKLYGGSLPKCTSDISHHNGGALHEVPTSDNRVGHFARDCRVLGAPGQFKETCPKHEVNKNGGMGRHQDGFMQIGGMLETVVEILITANPVANNKTLGLSTEVDKCSIRRRVIPVDRLLCSKAQEVHGTRDARSFAQINHKSERRQVEKETDRGRTNVREFSRSVSKDLPGLPPARSMNFRNSRSRSRSFEHHIDWPHPNMKELIETIKSFLPRFHSKECYTLEESTICFDQLQGFPLFMSKIDLKIPTYQQLRLRELEVPRRHISDWYGHLSSSRVMPFGLTKCSGIQLFIDSSGYTCGPANDESIQGCWASPKTARASLQFLGLPLLIEGALKDFSRFAKSMTKLTQKGIKFDWGEKEENAFQLIKQKLCSAPIMALPEGSEDFVVYCDASHKGLGKANVVPSAEAVKNGLSHCGVRALVMTNGLDFPETNIEAQIEAQKPEKYRSLKAMSTAYHQKSDGQSERTIQLSRTCFVLAVIDFGNGWVIAFAIADMLGRVFGVCPTDLAPESNQENTEKSVPVQQRMQRT
ncbi:putative reverse transcriptase domain-containing protein [Tanacetum coccineum]